MSKARNRNLAGLAGLAALGAVMARGGKKGADEAVPTPEDRGDMTGDAFSRRAAPAAAPAAASETRDYSREIAEHGSGIGLTAEDRAPAAAAKPPAAAAKPPGAAKPGAGSRSLGAASAASRPAPISYSAAEAATDLARESSRGVKPAPAAPAAPAATPAASSRGLTLGTPIRPAPGTPSIYAGREAWADYRRRQAEGMKKGGAVKKMASGGSVSSASKRGDGIAQRGKTRGRLV